MKYLISLAVLVTLLLIGCADKPISPIESDDQSYQMIKLPPKAGLSIENTFSVTKRIDGKKGGKITLKKSYNAPDGHKVKIHVELKIKKKSFTGHEDITMTIDDEFAAICFYPHMVFNKAVELKAKFEGIDLENLGLTGGEYDFVYIAEDGEIELVEHDRIDVDEHKGKIKFHGRKGHAKLLHFSRYCFIKR